MRNNLFNKLVYINIFMFLCYIVCHILVCLYNTSTISLLLIFLSLWTVISRIIDYKTNFNKNINFRKKIIFIKKCNKKNITSIFLRNEEIVFNKKNYSNNKFLLNTINHNHNDILFSIFFTLFFIVIIFIRISYLLTIKPYYYSLWSFLNYDFFNIIYLFIFYILSQKYLTKTIPFLFNNKTESLSTDKFFNYKKFNSYNRNFSTLFLNSKNEVFYRRNNIITTFSMSNIKNSIKMSIIFILFSLILFLFYKFFNFYIMNMLHPLNSEFKNYSSALYTFNLRVSLLILSSFYFLFPVFISLFIKDFLILNYLKKGVFLFISLYVYLVIHWNVLILKEAWANFHFVFSK